MKKAARANMIKPPARSVIGPYMFITFPVGSALQADREGVVH
jgi:hypothetical protein